MRTTAEGPSLTPRAGRGKRSVFYSNQSWLVLKLQTFESQFVLNPLSEV